MKPITYPYKLKIFQKSQYQKFLVVATNFSYSVGENLIIINFYATVRDFRLKFVDVNAKKERFLKKNSYAILGWKCSLLYIYKCL